MMNESRCPACGERIESQSINIAEGVALCPGCGTLSRLSDVISGKRPTREVLRNTPAGCAVADLGDRIVVRATLRSFGGFVGALAIALFWNGIVSVFVLIACAGLYTNLVGPLPAWFPAPQNEGPMTLGMALFLCCFLTPFVAIGSVMVGVVFLNAFGKVEIHIAEDAGEVRTGIAFGVWRQRFDPTLVRRVGAGQTSWESNGRPSPLIVIDADRTIKFGSLLADHRREWLQAILNVLLATTDHGERVEIIAQAMRDPLSE